MLTKLDMESENIFDDTDKIYIFNIFFSIFRNNIWLHGAIQQ